MPVDASSSSAELTRLGFTAHQHDRDLGLIDMRGRIYDPLAGRFMSPDPIVQEPYWSQGLNPYAYVFNDPINATDPSGFMVYPGYPTGLVISGVNFAGLGLGALNLGLPNPFAGSPSGTYRDVPADAARAATTTPATQSPANGVGQRDGVVGPAGAVLDQLAALEQRLAEYQQELLTENPRVLWELFKRAWPFRRMLLDAKPTLRPGAGPAPAAGARPLAPPAPPVAAARGPVHHIMTNKNLVSAARGGPWTPRFADMAKRAGMTLEDAANKVAIAGHRGPHPQAYHDAVFRRLSNATEGLTGDAYGVAFRAELEAIRAEAATAGSALNRLLAP